MKNLIILVSLVFFTSTAFAQNSRTMSQDEKASLEQADFTQLSAEQIKKLPAQEVIDIYQQKKTAFNNNFVENENNDNAAYEKALKELEALHAIMMKKQKE